MTYLSHAGARSTLTKTPSNVVVEAGTDATLECSSDISAISITWDYDGNRVVGPGCTSLAYTLSQYVTESTVNDCHLTAVGNYTVEGVYGCTDGSGKTAQAVVVVVGNLIHSE